jgi:hypothetical protein
LFWRAGSFGIGMTSVRGHVREQLRGLAQNIRF